MTWKERLHHYAGLLYRTQFLRFLAVGGINTAFSYGVFAFALYIGFHYALASLTSIVLGILFSFFMQGRLVFNSTNPRLLVRFFAVSGILYLVHTGLLKAASYFSINLYLAGAVLTLPLSLISYVLNKYLVFRPSH